MTRSGQATNRQYHWAAQRQQTTTDSTHTGRWSYITGASLKSLNDLRLTPISQRPTIATGTPVHGGVPLLSDDGAREGSRTTSTASRVVQIAGLSLGCAERGITVFDWERTVPVLHIVRPCWAEP